MFRYAPGQEDKVVEEIMQLAEREDTPLDWLDAATLSFQITQHAAADCCSVLDPTEQE